MTKSTSFQKQNCHHKAKKYQIRKKFNIKDLKKIRQPAKNKRFSIKWRFLEHRGPVFPQPYKMLPSGIHFKYNGKPIQLSAVSEEVMTYYAKLLDKKYAQKKRFIKNFFEDWKKAFGQECLEPELRVLQLDFIGGSNLQLLPQKPKDKQVMSHREQKIITNFYLCDFNEVFEYFQMLQEQRNCKDHARKKNRLSKLEQMHGYCNWDGRLEKLNNYRIESPGLFIGRGSHPKMGRLKRRIMPEDVVINCSPDSSVPAPPSGHSWKDVQHKNQVTWLASWIDNVSGVQKYIMPDPSSLVMTRNDVQKFETARKLKRFVESIRKSYLKDMKSADPTKRQLAVALYFIDKLSLRAGNEKEDCESADTVGCCSLRCEHVRLHRKLKKKNFVVVFDFLGKDSIPYRKKVQVGKQVYSNLLAFKERKRNTDKLFNLLSTALLNKYLDSFMKGLTAKVFRTYNASITLQRLLKKLNDAACRDEESKILAYNQANRAVALLCNHQRAPPKNYNQQVVRMKQRVKKKVEEVTNCQQEVKEALLAFEKKRNSAKKKAWKSKKLKLQRLEKQLLKLKLLATVKVENKKVALITSKSNYIDPRITVAWCLKNHVGIEKIYNRTQREKFAWAINTTTKNFSF